MRIIKPVALSALFFLAACTGEKEYNDTNVIPRPDKITFNKEVCLLGEGLNIVENDSSLMSAAAYLKEALVKDGMRLSEVGTKVTLSIDRESDENSYTLHVGNSGIEISGGSYGAVVNGTATLRQMLWCSGGSLKGMEITDSPRFEWRGAMLDVSRHFFTTDEVKSLIDEMTLYKFNKLHLHLTDDQGWRIEIKSLPRLTSEGAWRRLNAQDSICLKIAEETKDPKYLLPEDRLRDGLYGGYYTQEDIRELVGYAAVRGIEIIPEIDFPGHSLAVIESYPDLSCSGRGGSWGTNFSSPLCLGNDDVIAFCKTVLDEVFDLFPSSYIHLGGDEVERTEWENCAKCQRRIQGCGLAGTEELQPWFTKEMERYCAAHGKTMIGWDEVVSSDLTDCSVIMWWRNWSPASLNKALSQGHRVVVSPSEYYYLADDQDKNTLAKVYNYDPCDRVPDCIGVTDSDTKRSSVCGSIIGIQGHLWSEKAATIERVGERIFPRLLAIAESAWTEPDKKDFDFFMDRLPLHLEKLDLAGWKYRMEDVRGVCDRNFIASETTIDLDVPQRAELYYTTDGSIPDMSSARYTAPFVVKDSCLLRYRCYNSKGVAGELCEAVFVKREPLAAVQDKAELSNGLLVNWYDFTGDSCSEIEDAPIRNSFICNEVTIPDDVTGNIGLIYNGYISIPKDGTYMFYTYSDDGSVLLIDGETVVDNDGLHSRAEKTGKIALKKGLHEFTLKYFDPNGGILEAGMTDRSGAHIPFPEGTFKH